MSIDHDRVIAFHGVCGYGDDNRTQPLRLGWGVGTNGYVPMVERFLIPLVQRTACRRIFLHMPWPTYSEKLIPLDGPLRMKQDLPQIYESFMHAFTRLSNCADDGDPVDVIEYHGAATQLSEISRRHSLHPSKAFYMVFEHAIKCGHSFAIDMASALAHDHEMSLIIPLIQILSRQRSRVYVEQRPRVDQSWFVGIPTVTMYSELLRQEARGGEPSLMPFDSRVENVLVIDRAPPDRDPTEPWETWIIDQIEAWQADGFTPAIPIHGWVKRDNWDLLRRIFGDPAASRQEAMS